MRTNGLATDPHEGSEEVRCLCTVCQAAVSITLSLASALFCRTQHCRYVSAPGKIIWLQSMRWTLMSRSTEALTLCPVCVRRLRRCSPAGTSSTPPAWARGCRPAASRSSRAPSAAPTWPRRPTATAGPPLPGAPTTDGWLRRTSRTLACGARCHRFVQLLVDPHRTKPSERCILFCCVARGPAISALRSLLCRKYMRAGPHQIARAATFLATGRRYAAAGVR